MAGHAFPVFLEFKGGKAVASFVGAFLCLTPLALAWRSWLFSSAVVAWTRHISMGSIVGAATFPAGRVADSTAAVAGRGSRGRSGAAFIIYKHSTNIARLRAGTENVFTFGAKTCLKNLAIIGGGSWGTALAIVLAPRFERIRLWVYETGSGRRMARHTGERCLSARVPAPGQRRSRPAIWRRLSTAPTSCSASCRPTWRGRSTGRCCHFYKTSMFFVSATKGLENETLLRVSGGDPGRRSAALRAARRSDLRARPSPGKSPGSNLLHLSSLPTTPRWPRRSRRPFPDRPSVCTRLSDPVGVEIGGSIKNVVAIGAGVLHGMGLGHNATAALITRGLAEMTRLAVAMGGKPLTLAGLAGLGDLVLTCTGELSRNRTVGIELAHGRKLDEIVGP